MIFYDPSWNCGNEKTQRSKVHMNENNEIENVIP